MTALAAIFVFFLVVVFHEFGHFIVAKLVDIKVHEFSIGMGPRIFKVKKGETDYSLRALPIGGYVKMEGEDEKSDDIRSFSNKPVLARMAVIAAGAIMNFILALLVFSLISYIIGAPTTTIMETTKDMPAYNAGIKSGDKIISVNNIDIDTWDELVSVISKSEGKELKVTVLRNNKKIDFYVDPVIEKDTGRAIIGIVPEMKKSILYSIKNGFDRMIFMLSMMFRFLRMLLTGNVNTTDVIGPVGIIHLVGEAAKLGFLNVLSLAGLISVNLGFFNLLPIPALDGSRLMFLIIELFRGKPIDPEKEGFIHFVGFVFLMLLMIFIAYKDLIRFNVF
ncbi:RIP metalloprotease RseP [Thermohalobacter berrensis]|uniref:Zinc metalloprotease n=1 Tax=Thermohalobacter berrensis TaxID=99594 RepID=A0A419TAG9_9FIRM|nr:RIP metalloprotease RseP [Thermohalobacter berrensis]RKD34470.1 RIP metalloprotease RseP [Thermohalobacter berrensis]